MVSSQRACVASPCCHVHDAEHMLPEHTHATSISPLEMWTLSSLHLWKNLCSLLSILLSLTHLLPQKFKIKAIFP